MTKSAFQFPDFGKSVQQELAAEKLWEKLAMTGVNDRHKKLNKFQTRTLGTKIVFTYHFGGLKEAFLGKR